MKKAIHTGIFLLVLSITFNAAGQENQDSTKAPKKEKGSFLKGLAKTMTKGIGNALTKKTADLNEVVAEARYISNLYPKSLKAYTSEEEMLFENIWKDGANIVAVRFWKKGGIAFYEIEGTIKMDGEPMPYINSGYYAKTITDSKPHTISIETTSGQKAELKIKPTFPIKVVSPNKIEVDMEKDLTVQLTNPAGSENTGVRLAVFTKPTISQTGWTTIDYFKSLDKITIPAAILLKARGGFKLTDSYLLAERYSLEMPEVSGIGEVRLLSLAWDYAPIKAKNLGAAGTPSSKEKDGVITAPGAGISINRNEEKSKSGYKMAYNISNLGYATNIRPLKQAKKLAVIGFTVRGIALTQEQTHNWTTTNTSVTYEEHSDYTEKTTTTTTTEWSETVKKQFPEFPKKDWDALTAGLFKSFEQTMKEQGIEIIPVEKVLQSNSYKDFPEVPDNLTETGYTSSYKGLKNIFGGGFSKGILAAVGSPQRRLMKELGVDGTVTVNVDMAMPWEGKTTLQPRLEYSILGNVNGYETFPCPYAKGKISGDGVDIQKLTETKEIDEVKTSTKDGIVTETKTGKKKKTKVYTSDALEKVIRKDLIFQAMTESLTRMKEEEDKSGYFNELWKLKY